MVGISAAQADTVHMEVTLEILPNVKEMPLTQAIEFCKNEPMVPACYDIEQKSNKNNTQNFELDVEDGFASYQTIQR